MKYLDTVQLINSVEIRTNRLLDANQQNYIKQKLLVLHKVDNIILAQRIIIENVLKKIMNL